MIKSKFLVVGKEALLVLVMAGCILIFKVFPILAEEDVKPFAWSPDIASYAGQIIAEDKVVTESAPEENNLFAADEQGKDSYFDLNGLCADNDSSVVSRDLTQANTDKLRIIGARSGFVIVGTSTPAQYVAQNSIRDAYGLKKNTSDAVRMGIGSIRPIYHAFGLNNTIVTSPLAVAEGASRFFGAFNFGWNYMQGATDIYTSSVNTLADRIAYSGTPTEAKTVFPSSFNTNSLFNSAPNYKALITTAPVKIPNQMYTYKISEVYKNPSLVLKPVNYNYNNVIRNPVNYNTSYSQQPIKSPNIPDIRK